MMAERTDIVALDYSKSGVIGQIDDKLPTPLYHQIYIILRNKIIDKEFAHGDLLPSEGQTARAFGVSRITSKRALNELANDGLVIRERGRGTRVTHKGPSAPMDASIEGMLENIMAMGLETQVELLEFDYTPATEQVSLALGCAPNDEVQRAVRVRSHENEPFSYLVTFVPDAVGTTYSRVDLAMTPLLTLLERGGVVVSRAEQTLTATLADATVAPLLKLEIGAPLLRIRRIVYDQNDRAVEFITGLYRPDRYKYRMDLSRVQSDQAKAWSPTV